MKKWFENLKISAKLQIGFMLMAVIAAAIGAVGLGNIDKIGNQDTLLYQENTLGLDYAGNAEIYYQRIRFNALKMIISEESREESITNIDEYAAKCDEYLALYENGMSADADKAQYDELVQHWEQYKTLLLKAVEYVKLNDGAMAQSIILGEAAEEGSSLQETFGKLFTYNEENAKIRNESNIQLASNAKVAMAFAIAIGIAVAVFMGFFISGIISRPIRRFAEIAQQLAVGETEFEFSAQDRQLTTRKDEVGALAKAYDDMITNTVEQAQKAGAIALGDLTTAITVRSERDTLGKALTGLVERFHSLAVSIVNSAEQVDSGSKLVADSSMALSQGATEQAGSVEELSASMEEITSQTTQNAQNAQKTNELAVVIQKDADTGNAQMSDMLRAMEEINASSENIGKIIKVIEDIAFQTNILALNAAVEAARAGQYGKGFAVVAEEVRNLAGQSSKAAKETTELIENSIKKVTAGTKIANETASAFGKIVAGVAQAGELVASIATASNEQAAALEQVNQGITQISQVVQNNAASAEESAAASEQLSAQADGLKKYVSVFTLSIDETPSDLRSAGKTDSAKTRADLQAEPRSEEAKKKQATAKSTIMLSGGGLGKY